MQRRCYHYWDTKWKSLTKVLILLSFIGITTCLQSQTQAHFSKALKIRFIYGDEAHVREEILFEIKNNKVVGKITYPNTDKVLESEVELTDSQIAVINSFTNLVEQYKHQNCIEKNYSSSVQYYFISKDDESIEIRQFCDWKNLTFFDIKRLVFKNYLELLEAKKHVIEIEYFKTLRGKWLESTPLDKIGLTAICHLIKPDQNVDTSEYIEFTELNKVVIHRKTRKIFHNYHLEFRDENVYLVLEGYESGADFIYEHKFVIIESSNKKMKLKRG